MHEVLQQGIISQQTALKELRQAGKSFGMWTNITDEDIENAADQPQGGEEEGGEEGAPEEEGGDEGGGMEALLQGLAGQAEESPEQSAEAPAALPEGKPPKGKAACSLKKGVEVPPQKMPPPGRSPAKSGEVVARVLAKAASGFPRRSTLS